MLLIAEDNPLMRRLIRAMVEDLDPDVIECTDGAAACALYDRHRPDWLLMDISMQPMDGLTATREIVGKFPTARIVIITQHNDAATRARAFEAGACGFVGKDSLLPLRALLVRVRGH